MARDVLQGDDPKFSRRLRLDLKLGSQFRSLIEEMVASIHANASLRSRQDAVAATTVAVDIILANLLRAAQKNKKLYVALSLNANAYTRGPSNPASVSSRGIRRVVDYLSDARPALVKLRVGGQFRNVRGRVVQSHLTRIRATDQLKAKFDSVQTENFSDGAACSSADGQSPTNARLFSRIDLPLIRLKSPERKLIEFQESDETRLMREGLEKYNKFLSLQWIDLLLPDDDFRNVVEGRTPQDDQEPDANENADRVVDLLFQRRLYRVFNNGRFDHGGRFYGGWWQHIPSKYRKFITINWAPIAELDFSNMQIAMLYAMEGHTLEGDAYALEGIGAEYRKLLKRTLLALINAEGQIRPPTSRERPPGWTWADIKDAIKEKHTRIARHFGSGIGLRLQRVDSDIAEDVMMSFLARDVLVLPIHDSFLIYNAWAPELREAMKTAYKQRMNQEIRIDADPSFIETELPEDAIELDQLDVRPLENSIDDFESAPQFAGYRQRRSDFLVGKSDAWKMRFYTRG